MSVTNTNNLPKFNGGMAKGDTCVKCTAAFVNFGTPIGTTYCRGGSSCGLLTPIFGEHLHRRCGRCNYIWAEQTADKV